MHSCRRFFMEETALGSQNVSKELPQGPIGPFWEFFSAWKMAWGQKKDCPPEVPRRLEASRALRGRLETPPRRLQDASEIRILH